MQMLVIDSKEWCPNTAIMVVDKVNVMGLVDLTIVLIIINP